MLTTTNFGKINTQFKPQAATSQKLHQFRRKEVIFTAIRFNDWKDAIQKFDSHRHTETQRAAVEAGDVRTQDLGETIS